MDRRAGVRFPYSAARGLVSWAGANWTHLQAEAGWATRLEEVRAAVAFPLLYERIKRHKTEAEQLRVDVVLGMPGAQEAHDAALEAAFEGLTR